MASGGKKKEARTGSGQKSIAAFFRTKEPKRPPETTEPLTESNKRVKVTHEAAYPAKEICRDDDETCPPTKMHPSPSKATIPDQVAGTAIAKKAGAGANVQENIVQSGPHEADNVVATEGSAEAASLKPKKPRTGQDLVGKTIQVFWETEQKWFKGRVSAYNSSGKHYVCYEDGDKEWINLQHEAWKELEGKQKKSKLAPEQHAQSCELSSGSSVESDVDDEESNYDAKMVDSEDESTDLDSKASEDETNSPANVKPVQRRKPSKLPKQNAKEGKSPAKGGQGGSKSVAKLPQLKKSTSGQIAKLAGSSNIPQLASPEEGNKPSNLLGVSDWERFAARQAERFPFLQPGKIRDAAKKKPGDEGYNPRTLFIPPDWFKAAKVSEGQRQWWEFKARNFDSVLLFKMGKFYEMFEMDAHTGAEILGLIYMKGDQPHCGFPEANYHLHAERLARAGQRVVVIEQTETPDMLKTRNEERRAAGKTKVGVVNREVVGVLTKGTMVDSEMVRSQQDASYVMACTEWLTDGQAPRVGICAVDCATAEILVGSWVDDEMRTTLRAHVASLRPVELVLPTDLPQLTTKILLSNLRSPRVNKLTPGTDFWDAEETRKQLDQANYFTGNRKCPSALEVLKTGGDLNELALNAFGGAVSFLRSVLLDKSVVGLGNISQLGIAKECTNSGSPDKDDGEPEFVAMDGSALENLEILESSNGEREGSLLAALDFCATSAGRRRLKDWLCRPLGRVEAVLQRQDAVKSLRGEAADTACSARMVFKENRDMERAIAGLCASSIGDFGRNSSSVVLYEDAAKRKVNAFVSVLNGLQAIQGALETFRSLGPQLNSEVLRSLTTPGMRCPDFEMQLKQLTEAADWQAATLEGRVIPQPGVDESFDSAEALLSDADAELDSYLAEIRQELGTKKIVYVSVQKDSHLLEIPEEHTKRLSDDFHLTSQRKGFRRYSTDGLKALVKKREVALSDRETAMAGILKGLVDTFADNQNVWSRLMSCVSELDALMSLAAAAEQMSAWGPVCLPDFVRVDRTLPQIFEAENLRHPAMLQGEFVPNDIQLGNPNFAVITGPNMGGKSTLIRQVGLAAALAHAGCYVPAKSLQLSPIDAIYVRMGARDNIVSGQSTFFVELTETAAALNRATSRSLVGLDELGRGTATCDGAAIASAVLQYLASSVGCRGLFATHYHRLSDEHEGSPHIHICHMACRVDAQAGHEQVTFLYKLVPGACPKSYGTNVARLAGIPDKVAARAAEFAAMLESRCTGPDRSESYRTSVAASKIQAFSTMLNSPGSAEKLRAFCSELKSSL